MEISMEGQIVTEHTELCNLKSFEHSQLLANFASEYLLVQVEMLEPLSRPADQKQGTGVRKS